MKRKFSILLAALLSLSTLAAWADPEPRTLKVLTIGSSFGVNSTVHLYQLAEACGATDIKVANLFRTAATIDVHWQHASGDLAGYEFRKNTTGTWTSQASKTMLYGLQNEPWDLIVIQQSAEKAAELGSYSENIENLITYINANKTNPNAIIAWNAVWSFRSDSIAPAYYEDQATMYYHIVRAVKERVRPNPDISFVIPSGTAIQNARTTFLGDSFSADSMHLNSMGSYVVGLAWIKQIKGWSIDDITWTPSGYSPETLAALKEAANNAVASPKRITLPSPANLPSPAPPLPPSVTLPAPGADGKIVATLLDEDFNSYATVEDLSAAGWQGSQAGGAPTLSSSASPQNLQSVSIPANSTLYKLFNPVAVNYLPGGTSPGKNAKLVVTFDGNINSASGASQGYIRVNDAITGYHAISIGRRGNGSIRYSDSIASGSTDFVIAPSLPKFTRVKMIIKLTDETGEFYDVGYSKVDLYVTDMSTPITGGIDRSMIDRFVKTVDRFYVGGAVSTAVDNVNVSLVVDANLTPLQAWRLQKFNTIHSEGQAADGADADGDGKTNLEEFEAGSDPQASNSLLRILSVQPEGPDMKIAFSSAAGKTYFVERSSTLEDDSWEIVRNGITGDGGDVLVTVLGNEFDSSYYRVVVANP